MKNKSCVMSIILVFILAPCYKESWPQCSGPLVKVDKMLTVAQINAVSASIDMVICENISMASEAIVALVVCHVKQLLPGMLSQNRSTWNYLEQWLINDTKQRIARLK
jgi:hypothetical protein